MHNGKEKLLERFLSVFHSLIHQHAKEYNPSDDHSICSGSNHGPVLVDDAIETQGIGVDSCV